MLQSTLAGVVLALAPLPTWQAPETTQAPEAGRIELAEFRLAFTLPALADLRERRHEKGQMRARWEGSLDPYRLEVAFYFLDFRFGEPGDVTELMVDNLRRDGGFTVKRQSYLQGPYGRASFASLVEADLRAEDRTDAVGSQHFLGCVLEQGGYVLHVTCTPPPDEAMAKVLDELFASVDYSGEPRDPAWTLEEIAERWKEDAPDDLHEDFLQALQKKSTLKDAVLRTKNYLIMTSSSGGKAFAKQMEENYREIAEIFPFADVEGRRLMPVFLFRTPDEYYDFFVKVRGVSREAAERSKGHASGDYYATWYEAPGDPVHIHEATHQIFQNRLRLSGGGSWFQEGVAEYVESSPNERNEVARLVEDGRHLPLRDFFALKSLLFSSEEDRKSGGSAAGDHYKQAALLIEFLREGPLEEPLPGAKSAPGPKTRFEDFLLSVGKVRRNDLPAIEDALRRIYGLTIDELDAKFQEYCGKR